MAITGASGFLGRHLIRNIIEKPGISEIRILSRSKSIKGIPSSKNIQVVVGDLLNFDSLTGFLKPDCTVVNLAYLSQNSASDNILAAENLALACRRFRIKRLIHCSTAAVVGTESETVITESTPCQAKTKYENTKLEIEKVFRKKSTDQFDLVILRPTAVFGPEGKNLLKLVHDLIFGNRLLNYIKSCLYDNRTMNLIPVENVAAAIHFLIEKDTQYNSEVFIISDDEDPLNNFRSVESYFKRRFRSKNNLIPRIPVPKRGLQLILKMAGKSNCNPDRIYSSDKINRIGFLKPMRFEDGLFRYANWYEDTFLR